MLFLMTLGVTADSHACAGIVHEEGYLAESDAQEVIFRQLDDSVQVEYRVEYEGDASSFGWIIPIPGAFENLKEIDAAIFDRYRECTKPHVFIESSTGSSSRVGAGGCGSASKDDASEGQMIGGEDAANDGVDVITEGFSGDYEYIVVEAEEPGTLVPWLEENGWSDGGSGAALDAYVEEGGFQFVAISLNPTIAETGEGARELPPVRIQYDGQKMRFPATMGAAAQTPEMRTRFFVEGDEGAKVSRWSTRDVVAMYGGGTPSEILDDELREVSDDHAGMLRLAFADCEGVGVTRFDALTRPAVQDVDPIFRPSEDPLERYFTATIEAGESDPSGTGYALLLFPLTLMAGLRRWRS